MYQYQKSIKERGIIEAFAKDLLKEKTILITGGGTGLGRAMAERFLQLGAKVAICGRREEVLRSTVEEMMAGSGGEVLAQR